MYIVLWGTFVVLTMHYQHFFWCTYFMHIVHTTNAFFRCTFNVQFMYTTMYIWCIAMYVQCTMKAHKLYIWLPDECTLNAHCNVHCLFATVHLKHWLMYIWCALGRGLYMYFWMHFSHYNVIDAVYITCTNDLLTTYTITYIRMSY